MPIQPLETIGLAALSNAGDFRTSYELAARCIREGMPGDFVECGVFGGAQCAAMAKAILESQSALSAERTPRRVHLFDSFEGVPAPGPNDRDFAAGGHTAGASACPIEAVQQNMRQWGIPDELLVYHKGWFQNEDHALFRYASDSPPNAWIQRIPRIAILRVDLDLYEGTLAALKCFYDLLVPGGFCVIDDYALDGCRQAVNEFMGGGFPPITWQKP